MSKTVTVFGSFRPSPESEEYRIARETGKLLALAGFAVCNGGYAGTMEASARGAKEAGGHTIGVTATIFPRMANRWIEEEIQTGSLVERLLKLVELADAYVILQGGTGTLLELATVWEFVNKGIMISKPIVVVGSFWNPVIGTLKEELIWEGLEDCTSHIRQVATPHECVSELRKSLCNF